MKKVFAFIMVIFLIFSTDSFSADKPQKKSKHNEVEQITKKGARFAHKTSKCQFSEKDAKDQNKKS